MTARASYTRLTKRLREGKPVPWRRRNPFILIETTTDPTFGRPNILVELFPFRDYLIASDGQRSIELKFFKFDSRASTRKELIATMDIAWTEADPDTCRCVELFCDIDKEGQLVLDATDFPLGQNLQVHVQFQPPEQK